MSSRARLAASRCIFAVGQLARWMKSSFHHMGNYPDVDVFGFLCFAKKPPADPRSDGREKFLVDRPLWFRGCTKRGVPDTSPSSSANASRLLVHRRSPKWLQDRQEVHLRRRLHQARYVPRHLVHRVSSVCLGFQEHRDPTDPETRRGAREPQARVFRDHGIHRNVGIVLALLAVSNEPAGASPPLPRRDRVVRFAAAVAGFLPPLSGLTFRLPSLSSTVDDKIADRVWTFLAERIKVAGKAGALSDVVSVSNDKTKVTVTSGSAMSSATSSTSPRST